MPRAKKKARKSRKRKRRGKQRYHSIHSNMWNPETVEALYLLMMRNGLPMYRDWACAMVPGIAVMSTKDFKHCLEVTAQQMNQLFPHYLTPSPDRRKWFDQEYTASNIEHQIAFAAQQGSKARGYEHNKLGHRRACITNIRAALSSGWMSFSEIHPTWHAAIVACGSSTIGNAALEAIERSVENIQELPPRKVEKEAKKMLDVKEDKVMTVDSALSEREEFLIEELKESFRNIMNEKFLIVFEDDQDNSPLKRLSGSVFSNTIDTLVNGILEKEDMPSRSDDIISYPYLN